MQRLDTELYAHLLIHRRNTLTATHDTTRHDTTLQHGFSFIVATHSPQHTTPHCTTLQHAATHCNTLQHTCGALTLSSMRNFSLIVVATSICASIAASE